MPMPVTVLGTAHGWLYALFLPVGRRPRLRARWSLKGAVLASSRHHPFLSFVAGKAARSPQDDARRARMTPPLILQPTSPHSEDIR
jgi:hypothetical protein